MGSGDNGFYIASVYRKGMPWDYPEDYITHSPLFYAKNFKTPTMIVTGEDDWRTPMAQSQELFRALKVRGVDTVQPATGDNPDYHLLSGPRPVHGGTTGDRLCLRG